MVVDVRIDREVALARFMIRIKGMGQDRRGHPAGVVDDAMFGAFLEVVAGGTA